MVARCPAAAWKSRVGRCSPWRGSTRPNQATFRRMRNIDEDTITQAVIARHAQAADARLRDVMTSLV